MRALAEGELLSAIESGMSSSELAVAFACETGQDRNNLKVALGRLREAGLVAYNRGTRKWTRLAPKAAPR